jgi:hypothetical protein
MKRLNGGPAWARVVGEIDYRLGSSHDATSRLANQWRFHGSSSNSTTTRLTNDGRLCDGRFFVRTASSGHRWYCADRRVAAAAVPAHYERKSDSMGTYIRHYCSVPSRRLGYVQCAMHPSGRRETKSARSGLRRLVSLGKEQ